MKRVLAGLLLLAAAGCSGRTAAPEIARREEETAALPAMKNVADIREKDRFGRTALHYAAERGFTRLVHHLLASGVEVDGRDLIDETPLSLAVINGQPGCVYELLLAGADREAQTAFGRGTPLHRAVEWNRVNVARLLLDWGADPNARNRWGQTPLHVEADNGWHPNTAGTMLLLERGAKPELADVDGFNTLQHAAAHGNRAVLEVFVARGESLDVQTPRGSSLLDLALQRRADESAQYLFEKGARASRFPNAVPPLHDAAARDDTEVALHLLELGSNPAFAYRGETAREYGLKHGGNSDGVLSLLARSAKR